ncbi:MAG: DUF4382 domain-containing protein [Sphingobacteriaceae bacterium]
MKKNHFISFLVILIISFGITSCDKSANNATLKVRLTDAPANFQKVLIDIQDLQINASSDENGGTWQSLPIKKGVYNLLDFRNGLDTLLADVELPSGSISQMRLVLGANNQVEVGDQYYDLTTPSAQQSGLKFNVQAELTPGITYKLWIDFDAARSIVQRGNGSFSLKPVIRTFTQADSGAISGTVSPAAASPLVQAIANGDTISTIAGGDGNFLLRGVPAGLRKVVFTPVLPYSAKTVDNVQVTDGQVSTLGTISF